MSPKKCIIKLLLSLKKAWRQLEKTEENREEKEDDGLKEKRKTRKTLKSPLSLPFLIFEERQLALNINDHGSKVSACGTMGDSLLEASHFINDGEKNVLFVLLVNFSSSVP